MKKYRVGYTAGVYDMFHIGHLNLLRRAKELCDCLIVGVNADELVKNYKNKTPVIGEQERLAIIQSIKYVDRAFITHTLDKEEILKGISFDAVFVGDDWKESQRWIETEEHLQEKGIDVVFLPHTDGVSSTEIVEKIRMPGGGQRRLDSVILQASSICFISDTSISSNVHVLSVTSLLSA